MSANFTAPPFATVTDVQAAYIYNYCSYGLLAIVIFEHLLLLPREIEIVWRRSRSGVTWLLVLNRYVLIAYSILQTPTSSSNLGCNFLTRFSEVIVLLQMTLFSTFSALRVYAVCNRNRLLAFLIFFLNMIPFGTNMQAAFATATVAYRDPIFGPQCNEIWHESTSDWRRLILLTRISVILADVLALTFMWRTAGRLRGRTQLFSIILRDGTIYFIALLIVNIAQIIASYFPVTAMNTPVALFIQVFTSISITRFLLNLRQIDQPERSATLTFLPVSTEIGSFAARSTIIGNMGETLEYGFQEEINLDDPDMP